ncbi:MAG: hypothetical protein R6X33_18115 [Candidatus Brocadiia bacterium]
MKTSELLLLMRVLAELIALIERAIRTDRKEISVEELAEAFERANAAEADWAEALKGTEE